MLHRSERPGESDAQQGRAFETPLLRVGLVARGFAHC
jgi:hypothetical protein